MVHIRLTGSDKSVYLQKDIVKVVSCVSSECDTPRRCLPEKSILCAMHLLCDAMNRLGIDQSGTEAMEMFKEYATEFQIKY